MERSAAPYSNLPPNAAEDGKAERKSMSKKKRKKPTKAAPETGLDKLITNPRFITCVLAAVCLIAVAAIVLILTSGAEQQTVKKEFVPPPFDETAVVGAPDVPEELGWSELAVREGYLVHVCGVLNAYDGKTVTVWFASDEGNDVWLKLRMRDAEGTILGQTGIIRPGEYVERMELNDSAHSGDVVLEIMGYEPETYYSAGTVGLATTLTLPE